jgi:hypothetical protein
MRNVRNVRKEGEPHTLATSVIKSSPRTRRTWQYIQSDRLFWLGKIGWLLLGADWMRQFFEETVIFEDFHTTLAVKRPYSSRYWLKTEPKVVQI